MSVERADRIDIAGVRDGWAVLTICQFESWSELDDPAEALRRKLQAYYHHMRTPAFRTIAYRLPVRIELQCTEPLDDELSELCRQHGVHVSQGTPETPGPVE